MSTNLDGIPAGTRVAVDANILIYHFTARSRACERFLRRCQRGEISAAMPAHVALELLHRRMTIEAVETGKVTPGNVARKLGAHPERVRELSQCHSDFMSLHGMGVEIIPTTPTALTRVPSFCLTYGLLANDAALLAVMEEADIQHLATADSGLASIPLFTGYIPGDL